MPAWSAEHEDKILAARRKGDTPLTEAIAELEIVRKRAPGMDGARRVRTSRDIYRLFHRRFALAHREEFVVAILDNANLLTAFHLVSVGSLTESVVHPREVAKALVLSNAAAFVALHNHPGGVARPSSRDLNLTRGLQEVGRILGVPLVDHLIFADDGYCSLADLGLLA